MSACVTVAACFGRSFDTGPRRCEPQFRYTSPLPPWWHRRSAAASVPCRHGRRVPSVPGICHAAPAPAQFTSDEEAAQSRQRSLAAVGAPTTIISPAMVSPARAPSSPPGCSNAKDSVVRQPGDSLDRRTLRRRVQGSSRRTSRPYRWGGTHRQSRWHSHCATVGGPTILRAFCIG